MDILLLGNGFDLAHELPTRYVDFLEWIKAEYGLYVDMCEQKAKMAGKLEHIKIRWAIKACPSKFKDIVELEEERQIEVWKNIDDNIWIDYFLSNPMYQKENWIDFEAEISKVIQSIDKDFSGKEFYEEIEHLSNPYLENNYLYTGYDALFTDENGNRGGKRKITYSELEKRLEGDLNRLIRVLEIYLTEYVEKMDCKVYSPDIEEIRLKGETSVSRAKIICFNYTNTFERIYGLGQSWNYNYIHGKADAKSTFETNNIVLGIDEYLPMERRSKDIEFITFKKFYQRIYKQTGCEYKQWMNEIQEENMSYARNGKKNPKINHLYIFGHSLDITDGDILRELILVDNVYTVIYYLNKKVFGQQIVNLVKVIGQDELIKRTGGSTKTIEFRQQKEMESKRR